MLSFAGATRRVLGAWAQVASEERSRGEGVRHCAKTPRGGREAGAARLGHGWLPLCGCKVRPAGLTQAPPYRARLAKSARVESARRQRAPWRRVRSACRRGSAAAAATGKQRRFRLAKTPEYESN